MRRIASDRAGRLSRSARGFTLIELLACIAVIAVLAAFVGSNMSQTFDKTKNLKCLTLMRKIGSGIVQYSVDNNNEFPRSSHNAWSLGKMPWSAAILPYLDQGDGTPSSATEASFNEKFRCPADKRSGELARSYGLNVFFQLGAGDLYTGSPATWWTVVAVPRPAATVLVAENRGTADHFMCHQWSTAKAAANAVDTLRHGKTSNYLFVDGHVESLPVEAVFNPKANINKWNPSLAN